MVSKMCTVPYWTLPDTSHTSHTSHNSHTSHSEQEMYWKKWTYSIVCKYFGNQLQKRVGKSNFHCFVEFHGMDKFSVVWKCSGDILGGNKTSILWKKSSF